MIPTGAKLWFGISAFALVACVAYFIASDGEEYGSMVLLSLVVAAFTLAVLSSLTGDGDSRVGRDGPAAGAEGAAGAQQVAGADPAPQVGAAWPALAAVGIGIAVVGMAVGGLYLYLGLLLVAAAGVEWTVQAWSEQVSGDQPHNQSLRNRLMHPVEIPVLAAAVIAVVVIAFSRVLLAVSKTGSTVVAIVVATVILGAAFLITSRPKLSSSLVTGVVVIGAFLLLGGGIVSAVAGEREFEEHGEEAGGAEGEEGSVELLISASSTSSFDTDVLNAPAGVPVAIVFENRQGGVQHNVHLTDPLDVQGPLVIGPDTATFEVTFEETGEHTFICDVYPEMEGTIEVVEQPSEGTEETEAPDEGQEGGGAGVDELDGDGS